VARALKRLASTRVVSAPVSFAAIAATLILRHGHAGSMVLNFLGHRNAQSVAGAGHNLAC
jgi:hypothetical protein